MLVLSNRFACATASMMSTTSFGHGPRSSTVNPMSAGRFLAQLFSQLHQGDIDRAGAVGDLLIADAPDGRLGRVRTPRNLAVTERVVLNDVVNKFFRGIHARNYT